MGILLGVEPGAPREGIILVGVEGALTTIEARGMAVEFCDSNETEGEKVGVGKRVVEAVVPERGHQKRGHRGLRLITRAVDGDLCNASTSMRRERGEIRRRAPGGRVRWGKHLLSDHSTDGSAARMAERENERKRVVEAIAGKDTIPELCRLNGASGKSSEIY